VLWVRIEGAEPQKATGWWRPLAWRFSGDAPEAEDYQSVLNLTMTGPHSVDESTYSRVGRTICIPDIAKL
jgi:hypothetical protein